MRKSKINTYRWLLKVGYLTTQPEFSKIAERANILINYKELTKREAKIELKKKFGSPPKKEKMKKSAGSCTVYGQLGVDIEMEAYNQIMTALKTPRAIKGALMPDGHVGYGLPIGGVVALDNAVNPYYVGYDIACRMTMSILEISKEDFLKHRDNIAQVMRDVSSFGLGADFADGKREHKVMDDERWKTIRTLKNQKDLAASQLGSSGGGNHFFDAMLGEVKKDIPGTGLTTGDNFVCIVTHSGSRGVGNKMARHYAKESKDYTNKISRGVNGKHAWLDLDTDIGTEYWEVMNLMGEYAQANHHLIHQHFARRAKIRITHQFENHHNFAWKKGNIVIHRKGATPAHKDELGIIPGTMGTPSYFVRGLGNKDSLMSSAHGAGRPMSRTEAKRLHNADEHKEHVKKHDILTFGVATDESYQAYKNIDAVMAHQEGILVETLAEMFPKIVIMGGKADDGD